MADTVRAAIVAHDVTGSKFTAFSGVIYNETPTLKVQQFAEATQSLISGTVDYTRMTATTNIYPSSSVSAGS